MIDDEWISFLKSSGANIGLSIDGPQWLHDLHRKNRKGIGTFALAMRAAELLHKNEIPFVNIATVTKDSLDHADEIFDFFLELNPSYLGFNIEEAEGANAHSSLYSDDKIVRVEKFFQRIAERNFALRNPLQIREIHHVLTSARILNLPTLSCQETQLGRIVSVSTKGDVALFSPELLTTQQADGSTMSVGNILTQNFEDILGSQKTLEMQNKIQDGVETCRRSCSYFNYCGGGSPANKYFESNRFDIGETWYCQISKQAVTHGILEAVKSYKVPVPFDEIDTYPSRRGDAKMTFPNNMEDSNA